MAFTAYIGSRAVNGVVLSPDFYFDALDDGEVFESVFTALLEDPGSFIDAISSLFEKDGEFSIPSFEEFVTGTEDALNAVDESLANLEGVASTFEVVEPIALVAFLAAVVLLALATVHNRVLMVRWVGGAVGLSGGVALVLWFALQGLLEDLVVEVALDEAGGLPRLFTEVMRSAVVAAVDNLSPAVIGPAVIALVVGALGFAASFVLSTRPRA